MVQLLNRQYLAYFVALVAVLLGGYGVAFAGASKQNCLTRYRHMFSEPTHVLYCQGSCPGVGPCVPTTLSNGLTICGCAGTNPSAHYDAPGESATTNCVDTIDVVSPTVWIHSCQPGSCTTGCGINYTYIVGGDPPEFLGQEFSCFCT